MDERELRNAISMAIDRDFLAEKVWSNSMFPGYSMVPPGIEGYTPAMADYADMSQIDREDEAKKILEKLGYTPEKPLKMEIRYNTSENHKNTAVAIQEQLKPLGVEVTLLNTDTKTHYGFLEQKGDYDVARAGWIADYKDPETFLGISRKASGNNYSSYDSPKFEELMDKAAAAGGNPEERMKDLSRPRRCSSTRSAISRCSTTAHNIVSPKLARLRRQRDGRPSVALHQQGTRHLVSRRSASGRRARRGHEDLAAMLTYVIRRLFTAIPTLFVIVTMAFFLIRVAPGGPFNQERGLSPEVKANLERAYGLDDSLWQQYLTYLNNLLHGNFGPSYNLPDFTVGELFAEGLPISVQLGASALILALIVGGTLGIVAALNQNRFGDYHRDRHRDRRLAPIPTFVIAPIDPARLRPHWTLLPIGGWGGGALLNKIGPDPHAVAAADRHRGEIDARLDDRSRCAATTSAPRVRSACPIGRWWCAMPCAARSCRSSPMPARQLLRCSPARSSSRRSSPSPASAAISSMPR